MADKQWLAQEAERLKADPVFTEALARIRAAALDRLATADADDKTSILSLQATVRVCDGIRQEMEAMILSREEKRPIKAV